MPDLLAVQTAIQMLSPVIILGSMLDFVSLEMVNHVSTFSLFSKAIKPKVKVSFRYSYRSALRQYYICYAVFSYLNPIAIVLNPFSERVLIIFIYNYLPSFIFKMFDEFYRSFYGEPFTKTQNLPCMASLTRTDIDWNLD